MFPAFYNPLFFKMATSIPSKDKILHPPTPPAGKKISQLPFRSTNSVIILLNPYDKSTAQWSDIDNRRPIVSMHPPHF